MTDALALHDIAKSFTHDRAEIRAVDGISLVVRENEFYTLLGPSGCGKTTLLRLVAGLDMQDRGRIVLGGEDISALRACARPVNTVFQNYALFPHMSVFDNVAFGLRMRKVAERDVKDAVRQALGVVRMEGFDTRRPAQLSGGQQQRVALARAIVNRPRVLLLDEPLSALDYKLRKEMQTDLKYLQRDTGIAFVFVTHDQDEALSMSDRIAVMDRGRIVQEGTPHEIYANPASRFVAEFIGTCNFARGTSVGLPDTGEVGFRPEDVAFTGSGAAGTIAHVNYRGPVTHYHIRLATGENIVAASSAGPAFRPGDAVRLGVNAGRVIRCGT